MSYNLNKPMSRSFRFEDFNLTYLISGTIVPATDIGKAVSLDATAAGTVKLAANNDVIIGQLDTYEDRTQEKVKVAGVARKVIGRFPIKAGLTAGEVVVLGSTVVGAGAGEVKARTVASVATPDHNMNVVTAIEGTFAIVELI